jgi:aspartate kinase
VLFRSVSAIGKTTNALELLVKSWFNNSPDKLNQFDSVREFHLNYIDEAFGESSSSVKEKIEVYFDHVYKIISENAGTNYDMAYDAIVSYGELFSTLIFSEYLKLKGIYNTFCDARDIIITDANNRDAKILWNESADSFKHHNFSSTGKYVIQGFIGRSVEGTVTTLGREGSDYTASALAYLLNAESVSIWKDVPGIMNADPAWCDFAQKLDVLSYLEAIELAFFGAKVIHPKTIKPSRIKTFHFM